MDKDVLDLILAIAHHFLAFSLVAIMLSIAVLLGITPIAVRGLSRLDSTAGAVAGLLLVIGVLRVIFGAKGWGYYAGNLWFWAKMAAFLLVSVLSIPPTLQFGRWRRRAIAEAGWEPSSAEVAASLRYVRLEFLFVVLVPAFAAVAARYG